MQRIKDLCYKYKQKNSGQGVKMGHMANVIYLNFLWILIAKLNQSNANKESLTLSKKTFCRPKLMIE